MLCSVSFLAVAVALVAAGPVSNVFEIDISPEEAQKYLNSPPFSEPQLSGRTAVLPLVKWNDPSFRSAEAGPTLGHYWKNGKEIDNIEDYVEEVYDASQFHGQDGLGAYAYGYQAPESAKVENRAKSGEVTGSYTFRDGNNELIKVRYWADSEGFHQEDNLPKVVLEPVKETDEVREARLAHEKAWQEAAAAAAVNPDPQGEYSSKYEEQASPSERKSAIAAPREGRALEVLRPQGKQRTEGNTEEPEPTGPPRGFFYSFNYPVSILVPKNAAQAEDQKPGQAIDHDTVALNARKG